MIKSFSFLISKHQMLHNHTMAFFQRIEFETSPFADSFFAPEFLPIVNRHPRVLKKRLKDIYRTFKRLPQASRSLICKQIEDSNNIEAICNGTLMPVSLDKNVRGVKKTIRELFIALYVQVLDGDPFKDTYSTNLREHFNNFRKNNNDITLCPICGISELKMEYDLVRDQYDHYLPKSLYPFSTVNFENLILACVECNSLDNKGDRDIINYSTGFNFFPFDSAHRGIQISFSINQDAADIGSIEWSLECINPDGNEEKVESWKEIYNIHGRYIGYVKGRMKKWYRHFWEIMNDSDFAHLPEADRQLYFFKYLDKDQELGLSFIRRPALVGFLNDSVLARAEIEAALYS